MPYSLKQFDTHHELVDFLNDVILGGIYLPPALDLDGKTLIIDPGSGNKTVTFSGTLTPNQIVAAINGTAGLSGAASLRTYRQNINGPQLLLPVKTHILRGSGTANALLGLPTSDTTVGAAEIAQSKIVAVTTDESGNKFSVIYSL